MTTNERVARSFLWLMLGIAISVAMWFVGIAIGELIGGLAS